MDAAQSMRSLRWSVGEAEADRPADETATRRGAACRPGLAGGPAVGVGVGQEQRAVFVDECGAGVAEHGVLLGPLQRALAGPGCHPGRPRNDHGTGTETARLPTGKTTGTGGAARMRGVEDLGLREGISPREQDVLTKLGEHLTNAEIAQELHVSVRTVESHVSSLLRKLGDDPPPGLAVLAGEHAGGAGRARQLVGAPAVATTFIGRHAEREAIRARSPTTDS